MDASDIFGNRDPQASELNKMESGVTRRILVKSGLPGNLASSFAELKGRTNFPYRLVPVKIKQWKLKDLYVQMKKAPTKHPIVIAYEEAAEQAEEELVGLVFNWVGAGGIHVLTRTWGLPTEAATDGCFWYVDEQYYLLQHLDSFAAMLGSADDW